MFCIPAPTQLALGQLAEKAVADASGLFNLMRNLDGAIGIAIIDTVIYTGAPEHARNLIDRLSAGDLQMARTLGLQPDALTAALLDPDKQAALSPLVEKVAFVKAINDAWGLAALITLAAVLALPWAHRMSDAARGTLYE